MALATQVQERQHLLLSAYEREARATNQIAPDVARDQLRFGLFGEVGGLLALVKKTYRELAPADHNRITEELGDALWYLANVAVAYEVDLQQVGERAMVALSTNAGSPSQISKELSFDQFDALMTLLHEQWPEERKPEVLRRLAARAGQLMAQDGSGAGAQLFDGHVVSVLGELLADMVVVAALFNQRITDIAGSNVKKIKSRWPGPNPVHILLFDEGCSELEKFPRKIDMHFIECRPERGRPYVVQRLNEVNIGDRLTDNRSKPDGYRFHDVFHLAYLTHLGWSPVIRALLKLKRKSDPELDENEDGARAIIIEEGIATWIFNQAHKRDYFKDVKQGRLDYDMLKQVVDMVEGYEVDQCPLWQWERAILDGFRIFRALSGSETGCGIVKVDLQMRTMEFIEQAAPRDTSTQPKPRQRPVGALPPSDVAP
jgi:NTP pyrophosphatase (non-canonical NTP hydrolase)